MAVFLLSVLANTLMVRFCHSGDDGAPAMYFWVFLNPKNPVPLLSLLSGVWNLEKEQMLFEIDGS